MREGGEEGAHGGVWGAGGARAGLGWVGPGHFVDRNPRHARLSNRLQSRTENRDETRRTRNIRQRNVRRHDATPMTLRFLFIHDTDTCHYTGLKLGGGSGTGREKRVTPEFGERKEEKNSTPKFRALHPSIFFLSPWQGKEEGERPTATRRGEGPLRGQGARVRGPSCRRHRCRGEPRGGNVGDGGMPGEKERGAAHIGETEKHPWTTLGKTHWRRRSSLEPKENRRLTVNRRSDRRIENIGMKLSMRRT
jgi:hypothetical protein